MRTVKTRDIHIVMGFDPTGETYVYVRSASGFWDCSVRFPTMKDVASQSRFHRSGMRFYDSKGREVIPANPKLAALRPQEDR